MLFSEPKIPQSVTLLMANPRAAFQCSSASRKFLNHDTGGGGVLRLGFSALQRAENSSIVSSSCGRLVDESVSVLFSEPKIPQSVGAPMLFDQLVAAVSVLFSEPKIPQSRIA